MNYLKTIDLMRVGQRYKITLDNNRQIEGVFAGEDCGAVQLVWWSNLLERPIHESYGVGLIVNVAEAPLPEPDEGANTVDVLQEGECYAVWLFEGAEFCGVFERFHVPRKQRKASAIFHVYSTTMAGMYVGNRWAVDVRHIERVRVVR